MRCSFENVKVCSTGLKVKVGCAISASCQLGYFGARLGETPPRGATQVGQGRLAVSTNWEAEARLRTRDDMAISGFASSQPLSCERASADFHFVSSPTSSGDLITHLDDPRGGFLAPSFDREVYETNSE